MRQPVRFAAAMETVKREHRPDVVLELAPHCALQPLIAQCLQDGVSPPPSVLPTLMKDSDTRLAFLESLGALFRAGVALDFASQYPRPEPLAHLLPGHPRDEEKSADALADDEFHNKRNEYAHAPLIGHRIACDHPLFEARLSERAFPWLADHRVQHAAIMPAAGYVELILEAFGGAPVHIEAMEFLQPCPVPKTPVRLQTALHPVANAQDAFTFVISTQPYSENARSKLHCRGRVRLTSDGHEVDVPRRLAGIDTSGHVPLDYADDDEIYERFDAVLGGTFQYGPACRTLRRVRRDVGTHSYLFDVEVDEELWASGRDEGFVCYPPLLDGGLQVFLFNLVRASDHFCIPRRIENLTFFGPATGPRWTCLVQDPPDREEDLDDKGQFGRPDGERLSGSISVYDATTGALVVRIAKYIHFSSNPRRADLPHSRHRVVWQPKTIPAGGRLSDRLPEGEIEAAGLIAALEGPDSAGLRFCHALEFAGTRAPDETLLEQCVEYLSSGPRQSEFWLLSDDEECARRNYEAFHSHEAALRFEHLEAGERQLSDLTQGMLRPGAVDLLLLHHEGGAFAAEDWRFWRSLLVAGGLALVAHAEGTIIESGEGWRTLRSGRRRTLFQAPRWWPEPPDRTHAPPLRWVLGEPGTWAEDWKSLLDEPELHSMSLEALASDDIHSSVEWTQATDVQAIDFFCGRDPRDPTGEGVVSAFVAFIRELVFHRIEHAGSRCRLTVVTRGAAFDVECPRGSGLWGAVRGMAVEVGEEAGLDFRLVDLGTDGDLATLAWLDRCDLRERELAVREGTLWVPRISSIREPVPTVPVGEEPTYRLCVDNPGQIAGLQMKTYEPAPLAPGMVEIEVKAAALNFRDVMVTLGLLPASAYERSALGLEVGMEASGIVRRLGAGADFCRVGDEIVFTQGGCIANRAVVDKHFIFAKPARLSMEEAASSLSVYVTAYYALVHLARIAKGQRILIHSAMGGVGQAAIALARNAGAEIYATAGSESKRDRLLALGARAAFDSHHDDWFDQLMAATRGEGVDIVLNALAGRHLERCLEALRPGGWHCEIGKVDIYADNPLGLYVFRKNLRFAAIDVDRLMIDDPYLSRRLSETCLDLLDRGTLPPLPVTVFGYEEYAKALRLMTSGQHQGKLVLSTPPAGTPPRFPIVDRRPLLDPDATYLVTGGMGGFGLCLLPFLVSAGARHLTLMDRDPERVRSVEWVRDSSTLPFLDRDCEIDIVPGDVAEEADVTRCVANLQRPLKGVFHFAGVLDDCLLANMSQEYVARVFAPKARGALNLHRATAGQALDYFVLASSTASTFGSPGQINYSAANAYLDALAAWRRRQGLPALSYNMAAIAEVGMASRSHHVLRMARAAGMPPISTQFAISNLDYAMRRMSDCDHLVAALFKRVPWKVDSADYLRVGRLISNQDCFEGRSDGQFTLESVMAKIADKVAELCGHDEGDVEEPLSSFGLTSVSVAELMAYIQAEFNFQASALELMTTASSASLAHAIVHGPEEEETESEEVTDGTAETPLAVRRRARRKVSAFEIAADEHFPSRPPAESDVVEALATP